MRRHDRINQLGKEDPNELIDAFEQILRGLVDGFVEEGLDNSRVCPSVIVEN
jgi:hypothetical protein